MSLIKLADRVQEAYEVISASNPNGGVRPKDIVNYARPEDSPLHDHFNWDDHEAGEKWRLWQARYLLATVSIPVDEIRDSREYRSVNISENNMQNRRYFDIDTIRKSPKLRAQVKRQLIRDVQSMLIKYSTVKEIYRLINEPELKKLEADVTKEIKE